MVEAGCAGGGVGVGELVGVGSGVGVGVVLVVGVGVGVATTCFTGCQEGSLSCAGFRVKFTVPDPSLAFIVQISAWLET